MLIMNLDTPGGGGAWIVRLLNGTAPSLQHTAKWQATDTRQAILEGGEEHKGLPVKLTHVALVDQVTAKEYHDHACNRHLAQQGKHAQ